MLDRLAPHKRNWVLAALAALLLWFAWSVRSAVNPLLVGLMVAYILNPLVLRLERRGWSRKLAVNVIFGGAAIGGALLSLALSWQARALWNDVVIERQSFERIRDELGELVSKATTKLEDLGVEITPSAPEGVQAPEGADERAPAQEARALLDELYDKVSQWLSEGENRSELTDAGVRAFGGVWGALSKLFGSFLVGLTFLFLVPLYTWFLLFELERISSFVGGLIPRAYRDQWVRIGAAMQEMLGGFFRGRVLVAALKGAAVWLTLLAIGVPYSLLLGLLGGVLSFLPVIGPGIGHACVFAVALMSFDPFGALWRTGLVFAVAEALEGYVLTPKILGDSLGLHTVVVFAALTIFGTALGMFGMLIALPLAAAIVILTRELVLPSLRELAEEPPRRKS